jgi:putative nucleotidyltransferase with HDIG domain
MDRLGRYHRPTYEHSFRVGRLARRVAKHLGMPAGAVRTVTRAALLHDVGKVAVPIAILDKPAELSPREWAYLDLHCTIGADILQQTKLLENESYLVKHHHRWYAANNSLVANHDEQRRLSIDIIAVCDAYDAITSNRPYSAGQSHDEALANIEADAGTQFNPRAIRALREVLDITSHNQPEQRAHEDDAAADRQTASQALRCLPTHHHGA